MDTRPFKDFGLSDALNSAIDKLGYEVASPIQDASIPILLEGKDMVGQSPTGSGKTAAFGIPLIERIDSDERFLQAIVLCPTRELAVQVAGEFHKLSSFKRGINVVPVYGGAPFDRQARSLREGAQIVVGTPGRVLDHIRRKTLKLERATTIVLDEADTMLDMGFREDIETVLEQMPSERQTVMFSATMPKQIRRLIEGYTHDAENITVANSNVTAPDIDQRYLEVRFRSKTEVLSRLLDTEDVNLSIVFCNTKRTVDEVADSLIARGYTSDRLHGDMNQQMRTRVMNNFRQGNVSVLVATDVAGRGLDVDDIELVVNYDLPFDAEDYVHRIGRTGRAGRKGAAISLVAGKDVYKINTIQRHTGKKILREKVPTLDELVEKRADLFFDRIHTVLENGEYPKNQRTIDRLLEQGFSATDVTAAALHLLLEANGRAAEPIPEDKGQFDRNDRREPVQRRERSDRREPVQRRERRDRPERSERPQRDFDDRPPREDRPERAPVKREKAPPMEGDASGAKAKIFANIGSTMDINAGNLAGVFYNAAGLPEGSVGKIGVFPKHSLIEVPENLVDKTIAALDGVQVRGFDVRFYRDRSPEGEQGDWNDRPKRKFDRDEKKPWNRDDRSGGGGGGGDFKKERKPWDKDKAEGGGDFKKDKKPWDKNKGAGGDKPWKQFTKRSKTIEEGGNPFGTTSFGKKGGFKKGRK